MDEIESQDEAAHGPTVDSKAVRSFSWTAFLLSSFLIVPYAIVVTWLDWACLFQLWPFWSYAIALALFCMFAVPLALARDLAARILAIPALVWMFALPYVPWHDVKEFFLDANALRRGMTIEEVEERMAGWPVWISFPSDDPGWEENEDPYAVLRNRSGNGRLSFHAGWTHSDETCFAKFEGGVVVETRAHKD